MYNYTYQVIIAWYVRTWSDWYWHISYTRVQYQVYTIIPEYHTISWAAGGRRYLKSARSQHLSIYSQRCSTFEYVHVIGWQVTPARYTISYTSTGIPGIIYVIHVDYLAYDVFHVRYRYTDGTIISMRALASCVRTRYNISSLPLPPLFQYYVHIL